MTEPVFAADPARLLISALFIGLGSLFGGILETSGEPSALPRR
ncbi:hypothetical protein [Lachnoclostridium sp. An118]|nr:hypothetical protein [Lachnoclostridium sp. An118]